MSRVYVCVKGKEMGQFSGGPMLIHWNVSFFTVSVDREIVLPGFVEQWVEDQCCTTRHQCGPAILFCYFRQWPSVVEDQWLRWIIHFLPSVTIVGCCIAIARTFVTLCLVFWPGTSNELDYPLFGCAICSALLDFVVVLYWVVRKWCHMFWWTGLWAFCCWPFCCCCAERKWRQLFWVVFWEYQS